MKKILFLMMAALTILGCSKDSNDPDGIIDISFSKNEINIPVGDEINITINGVDISQCNLYSENDFIANVLALGGKANISAEHTGSTKIIAEYKNKKAECVVNVTSLINHIGNPNLLFGSSMSEIKKTVKGTIETESDKSIEFKEDFEYPIYTSYYFNNDKLECVCSQVNITNDFIKVTNSLKERYKYISSESKVHWYSNPNMFLIRMYEKDGNGGYSIIYAKDKDIMGKYYKL